ncbi:hypothetical protein ACA910_011193 [Epithemia clementina (nom. ined.)]
MTTTTTTTTITTTATTTTTTTTAHILLLPIPLILIVFLLGNVTCTLRPVHAACVAQYRNGNSVPLSSLVSSSSSYNGVRYNTELDELSCERPHACAGWKIAHCHFVQCTGSLACHATQFTDNAYVDCYGNDACHNGQFLNSHSVMCGMEMASNACLHTTMTIDGELTCWGPGSCVSTPPISVKVGGHGIVRCLLGEGGGSQGYSCQHMIVWVNHARRACFNQVDSGGGGDQTKSHCAVICEGNGECDKNTIQFRVL